MLVYQFMSRGSLNDHLHGPNAFKYPNLDWRTRLKITLDAAQGLEYLHWQMDEDVSQVFMAVRGTTRYLHPRYFTTHMLTKKSDVYSFGVVLLEIICGRRPIDTTLSEDKLTLIRWVTPFMEQGEDSVKITEIVD